MSTSSGGSSTGGRAGETYSSTLSRFLERQRASKAGFKAAEQPLIEARELFAPGGGYGAGQMAMIEEGSRKAKAKAFSSYVASGMSSGTNVAGTQARIASDVMREKLGVEDARTERLAGVLGEMSGLRAGAANQLGQVVDPTYAPYMSLMSGISQAQHGAAASRYGARTRATSAEKIASTKQNQGGKFEVREFKF